MAMTNLGAGVYHCTAFVLLDPEAPIWVFRCTGVGTNANPQDSNTVVSDWTYFFLL